MASELLLIEEELRGGENAGCAHRAGLQAFKKVTSGVMGAYESWPRPWLLRARRRVRELISGFTRRSGISVLAAISLPEAERASENPLAIVLYRLAHEALTNAEKHSGAKELEFSVGCENCWMTLSVRDDGRGFDMAKVRNKKTSLGLKIMAEAAAWPAAISPSIQGRGAGR
jgi:hypothetical protein